ncbi:XRE family transcriptional regulator [Streptomyces sp. LP11]|uniref:XRE family transcriptional regulator n=1 Tax=Streptomyces pyxinicus TaxID=2970331 RepID=A0ABT2B8E3_9ACTN|nr:XRE family transcriptional regulator [Streptomyces sp. LP11]MCS0604789.1 XRE family transcriptional regulator [Streptomyces sp. LP11]
MHHPGASITPDGQLPAELRELRGRTGLSLAALAARTPYSKSAWHRYLSGAQRPPRSAVEALCRLAGAEPGAVLALWDADGAQPPPPPDRDRRRTRLRWLPWLPLSALVLGGGATALAAALAVSPRPGAVPAAQHLPAVPRCHRRSCQGELPAASACARDAQTRSTVADRTYTVRLRYSPACGTVWSEVGTRAPGRREVSVRAGQDVLSASYPAGDTTGDSSPMLSVASPRGVEACAEVGGELACTGLDAAPDGRER